MSNRDHTSKSVVGFKIFANHEAIMFIEILHWQLLELGSINYLVYKLVEEIKIEPLILIKRKLNYKPYFRHFKKLNYKLIKQCNSTGCIYIVIHHLVVLDSLKNK